MVIVYFLITQNTITTSQFQLVQPGHVILHKIFLRDIPSDRERREITIPIVNTLAGNAVSKATLRLAAEQLTERFKCSAYFPAFEILTDDLRDYRFYADDLVHPAPQAVAYVWEKFAPAVLTDEALRLLPEAEAIVAAAAHRPRNPQGEAHRAFCRRQLERIAALPEMDFQSETAYFRRCLEINS